MRSFPIKVLFKTSTQCASFYLGLHLVALRMDVVKHKHSKNFPVWFITLVLILGFLPSINNGESKRLEVRNEWFSQYSTSPRRREFKIVLKRAIQSFLSSLFVPIISRLKYFDRLSQTAYMSNKKILLYIRLNIFEGRIFLQRHPYAEVPTDKG